jgi:hypothetical protein
MKGCQYWMAGWRNTDSLLVAYQRFLKTGKISVELELRPQCATKATKAMHPPNVHMGC